MAGVNSIISSLNFTIPLGEMDIGPNTHTLNVDERYFDIQTLKDLIVSKTGNTGIIYLRDVADVREAPVKRTTISRLSSK